MKKNAPSTYLRALRRPGKEQRLIISVGLLLAALMGVCYALQPAMLSFIDFKIFDSFVWTHKQAPVSRAPLIVDLDEKSLSQFGQWPWPRYRLASLLEKIKQLGAVSIGLDMVLAEPDRTSLIRLQKEMKRDLDLDLGFRGITKDLQDNDAVLARTLRQGPYVLGYSFSFAGEPASDSGCHLHAIPLFVISEKEAAGVESFLPQARGVTCNLGLLSRAVTASGFFNFRPDPDGMLRRAPLLVAYQGRVYPSLGLAALLKAHPPRQAVLRVSKSGVESLALDERQIPLDEGGNLLIRFRGGTGRLERISAADVLKGQADPQKIKGKIVLLGTSAAGLGDIHPMPFDPMFSGVEAQATIVDNILRGDFLYHPRWVLGLELMVLLVMGVFSAVLLTFSRALASLLILGLSGSGLLAGSYLLLYVRGVYVSPLYPVAVLALNFSVLSLLKYWREERRVRERNRQLVLMQEVTIEAIANVTETRDPETGGHIKRTQNYVKVLAEYLVEQKKFPDELDGDTIELLYRSAPLHDVGKVGIPDHILGKTVSLTEDEFETMKLHIDYGRHILDAAEQRLGENSFLRLAQIIVATHHERWDGSGYPMGLKGKEIPLPGRLMALADVYDALISRRPYKDPLPHDVTMAMIKEKRGIDFDPELVDAFLEIEEVFCQIAHSFADSEEERRCASRKQGDRSRVSYSSPRRT
ncbi:MAG: CHASE2 domain-containing protein [Desulfarculaceae bacterium]|jgi:adenylate cyclase